MLRWGILGITRETAEHVAPALRAEGHDLAIVASPQRTEAQHFAATQGVRRARQDYNEVLTSRDVDAVWVGLPPDERAYWVAQALNADKHVLCAKPLSSKADGAVQMATAAAAAGDFVLMEALPVRYHPRTTALLNIIRSGGIGDIRFATISNSKPSESADESNGQSAALTLGADVVSLLRWVMGNEPEIVRAVSRNWANGSDSTTSAILGFPEGRIGALHASFDATEYANLEIVGTKGTLTMPDPFTISPHTAASIFRDGILIGTWHADPWESLVNAFEAATLGQKAAIDVNDAVATAHVLDSITSYF